MKQNLENASEVAITWFDDNNMQANATKFQFFCMSRFHDELIDIQLNINGIQLPNQETVKLLGVHIDYKLNFNYHVSLLSVKIRWYEFWLTFQWNRYFPVLLGVRLKLAADGDYDH